jgi:SAM-dependent methyltransferase
LLRAATSVRIRARRLLNPLDRLLYSEQSLVPPAHLRIHYYGSRNLQVFAAACQGARTELLSHGLRPDHRILDVGSGIGNLAIGLKDFCRNGYDGLEIDREAVKWCQTHISPVYPSFRFHRADVVNSAYNPLGTQEVLGYRFPFADATFDVVYLGSVFTHMHPDDVLHYLTEISRVLRRDGMCVSSVFLLNEHSRRGIESGKSFMTFPHRSISDEYRLHDISRPEAAVAIDESFVKEAYRTAGLTIKSVRRGLWWSGTPSDQDVIVSTPK